jgi:hypothetical protein
MSEEDYMYDDEMEETEESGGRSPFLIAAGVLTVTLILAAICAGVFLFTGNGDDEQADAIAARETENAVIAVTNTAVAVTVEAMTAEAMTQEAITPTPEPTETGTPTPTSSPSPTNTPVIQVEEETETPTPDGTSEFELGDGNTPTPIAIGGEAGGDGTGTGTGTLPETGIDTWGAVLAAIVLLGVLVVTRRLRSG